jgi:hypothetical protein
VDTWAIICFSFFISLDSQRDYFMFSSKKDHIKFGTSVFHAYAHEWKCQVKFNPRFNIGWGLSDGEGLERLWSSLAPLVQTLRYSSRNHRLAALSHRCNFHNHEGRNSMSKFDSCFFFLIVNWFYYSYMVVQEVCLSKNTQTEGTWKPHRPSPTGKPLCWLCQLYSSFSHEPMGRTSYLSW